MEDVEGEEQGERYREREILTISAIVHIFVDVDVVLIARCSFLGE